MSMTVPSVVKLRMQGLTSTQLRLVQVAVVLLLIGSPIGVSISASLKFSVANILQIISALLLCICFVRFMRLPEVILLVSYIGGIAVSWIFLLEAYGLSISLEHVLYFAICILCLLLAWVAPKSSALQKAVLNALKIGVPAALLIMYGFAFQDMLVEHLSYTPMGFDDKSHAAVYIAALAFLVLEFSGSIVRVPFSVFVFGSSFLTVSRLSALMAPFFLIAVLSAVLQERKSFTSDSGRALYDLLMVVFVSVLLVIVVSIISGLPVFSRLMGSEDGTTSGSTQAHLELMRLAIELKFMHPWTFIFGSTPGMFSYLLPISGIDYSTLAILDPGSQATMGRGALPVHSVPVSIFLEFPIWLFGIYIFLLLAVTKNLVKAHKTNIWTMFVAMMVATVWYSGHNEPYFLTIFLISLFLTMPKAREKNLFNSTTYSKKMDIN